ncbi:hypothetical protein ACUN7V_07595 [Quadrisphaera oryzae]|uniref:hypothetical protein n=1 Tax=Quadrisphaera TaxID=317661 RepID=UPI001647C138|nr:hypothetical protein [Quadrisphaera sp. RL12-1S]MBC3763256.1 hypothetical protein [Quadrisphaera sp. RL12-1S]
MVPPPLRTTTRAVAVAAALLLGGTCLAAPAAAAPAQPPAAGQQSQADRKAPQGQRLANTGHLTTLTTRVAPPAQAGHTTYRLAEEPELGVLWTYAEPSQPSGSASRPGVTSKDGWDLLGGGTYDAATGRWTQGAFNADDVTRAAVAFTRHWRATGDAASREQAYELLRGATYLQTTDGPDAGNVVLWMQPDGQLNRSAEPVELPDPSDSAESYWLARTVWALGEGYAAFAASDAPGDREFAAFLAQRMALSLDALQRQSLGRYGQYEVSDGDRVPGWLITGGADATSEAVLGLAAFVGAGGRAAADPAVVARARTALRQYAEGVAAMGTPPTTDVTTRGRGTAAPTYPFGAVLPWTPSRSQWHAWGAQMPAALAEASDVLGDPALLSPAVDDASVFTPLLLASGGPDSSWAPAPVDRSQIAYGADARLASVLAVADESGDRALDTQVAGAAGAWFFGANPAGVPVYDPRTGTTNDGINADRTVNKNSGAESTIHGFLAALALDEHPAAKAIATQQTRVTQRDGLRVVEGEAGTTSGTAPAGSVVTLPEEKAWTGEAQWSGGAYRSLPPGAATQLALPAAGGPGPRWASVVVDLAAAPGAPAPRLTVAALDTKTGRTTALGDVDLRGVEQGVSAGPGSLRALPLGVPLPQGADALVVTSSGAAAAGPASLDAVLVVPQTPSLTLSTPDGKRSTTVTTDLTR